MIDPVVYFLIMAARAARVMVVNHRTTPARQITNLREWYLFAERGSPLTRVFIINNTVVRICEDKVASLEFLDDS
ncbi:hypothetical protein DCO57_11680 [Labrenzia sp. 011]|nr:hypothetical protein DCO57_11680 [Labrenzia sp. 011]